MDIKLHGPERELLRGNQSHTGVTTLSAYLRMEARDCVLPYTYFHPRGARPVPEDLQDADELEAVELLVGMEVQEDQ